MSEQMHASIRKRIQMFYFAAGANIVMGILVLFAAGWPTGVLAMLVFAAFSVLQFYMARNMRKRWEEQVRKQHVATGDEVNR
jgi:membrane protein implicated in regulation of membrane protease activity